MAIGTSQYSLIDAYSVAVTAGGPATQDAATITAASQIDGTTKRRMQVPEGVSHVAVRLGYDTATTAITEQCQIKMLGRKKLDNTPSFGRWEVVPNRNGDISAILTASPSTDVDDTLSYTAVDEFDHIFHVRNCTDIIIGVETAFSPTDGSSAVSVIEVKTVCGVE